MKKLDRLILRSFLGPLALTFAIAVFVLLMQFVWKYIDDMVGKGLSFDVLAQLLFYAAATFVPMALPIAVLFASIMTMGNFGEKYELVAMKAGGVSIRRVMMPLALVVLLLTGVAFYFANNVLPVAMLKYKMTLFDVTRKKPALNIKPSEYYTDIEGYVIRANEKDPTNGMLRDVIIYDHTHRAEQTTVVVADSGMMQTSPDDRYLILTLYNGHNYNEEFGGSKYETRPFTRIGFGRQVMTFDLSSFAFDKTNGDFFKGNYQMMNIAQLRENVTRLEKVRSGHYTEARNSIMEHLKSVRLAIPATAVAGDTATQDTLRVCEDAKSGTLMKIVDSGEVLCKVPLSKEDRAAIRGVRNAKHKTVVIVEDDNMIADATPPTEDQQIESAASSAAPYSEILNDDAPEKEHMMNEVKRRYRPLLHRGNTADRMAKKPIGRDEVIPEPEEPDYSAVPVYSRQALQSLSPRDRERVISRAKENMAAAQNELRMYNDLLHSDDEFINRHYIEWQRKFTLSIACLVLFLVGAPFGSIVRKGGLGLPLVASVFFFVLYYVVGMIAEKSVRESAMGPEGMWVSTLAMLPIGIVLTLIATTDGSIFSRSASREKRLKRKKHRATR